MRNCNDSFLMIRSNSNLSIGQSPFDVNFLEFVESSQDTSTGNTSQDIGAGTLHHGHEALVLEDLHAAIDGAVVFDGGTGGHHHTSTNGVNGVGHKAGSNGDTPTQQEGKQDGSVFSQKDGLQGIVETEVHATVDEDTDARDDEATVQALDTVGLDGLGVDVDQAVELTLATLAFGIVSQPGKIKRRGVNTVMQI